MKKAVLIGGIGMVGIPLALRLSTEDYEVVLTSRDLSKKKSQISKINSLNKSIRFLQQDDLEGIGNLKDEIENSDLVINLGNPRNCNIKTALSFVRLNNEILETALNSKSPPLIIHFGSVLQYSPLAQSPVREDMANSPSSPYSLAKILSENLHSFYINTTHLNIINLRISNIYGGSHDNSLVSKLIESARKGELVVSGNPKREKDFMHVDDFNDSIIKLIDNPSSYGQTLNIGTGTPASLDSVAITIRSILNPSARIIYVNPSENNPGVVLNISKLKYLTQGAPKMTLTKYIQSLKGENR